MSEDGRVVLVSGERSLSRVRDRLEAAGFAVTTTSDIPGTLSILETETVDCVVTAYRVPDEDGMEYLGGLSLLAALEADHESVPCVLYTDIVNWDIAKESMSRGVFDFVPAGTEGAVPRLVSRVTAAVERRRTERALASRTERLEMFASIVSHDLRNPLNVATGNLALLSEEVDDERLEAVEDALQRAGDIIDDIHSLARQGDAAVDPEPADLATIVERAWRSVETEGVRLSQPPETRIRADPSQVRRLFENLFRNAVEHGPAGSESEPPEAETVTVTVERTDGGFAVADDGTGLQSTDDIFDLGMSRDESGTGYGLAIVESIAAAHGWTVTATDSKAGGARFEFDGVEFVSAA